MTSAESEVAPHHRLCRGTRRVSRPSGLPEWLTPLSSIAAAQLFCNHVTRAKGLDTESPRGLRKVTLTH